MFRILKYQMKKNYHKMRYGHLKWKINNTDLEFKELTILIKIDLKDHLGNIYLK